MKKYIFITIASALLFFCSCEHESLPTYSGVDQIYFAYVDTTLIAVVDSVTVNFGYDVVPKADSTISIPVRVMGNIVDYDRPVNFILVSTSTAQQGRDVELLTDRSFVPAGKNKGNIYIKLYNTENLNDKSLLASLCLVENEYFKADYRFTPYRSLNKEGKIIGTQCRIRFENTNEMPNMWANPSTKSYFDMVFGTYSRAKFTLMCQILPGCTREYFTYELDEDPQKVFSARFPMGLLAGWARGLSTYLATYKNEHDGVPLYDENGREITSGNMFN
jgi:hypothetical protein